MLEIFLISLVAILIISYFVLLARYFVPIWKYQEKRDEALSIYLETKKYTDWENYLKVSNTDPRLTRL